MELSEGNKDYTMETTGEVYRVIDDGTCILTTLDARKALVTLNKLIEHYDITQCWADVEVLR